MKRLLTFITIIAFAMATMFTSVQASPLNFSVFQAKHLKKDGTPDKRFKENKKAAGPLTKSGKPDMRYKANNPNAGKKKKAK